MKVLNKKPYDLHINHKLWKSGQIIEISDLDASGLFPDLDFEIILEDSETNLPSIEKKPSSKKEI